MKKITLHQAFEAPLDRVFDALSKHATFNTVLWPIQSVRIEDSRDAGNPDGVGSVRKMGVGPLKAIREQITRVEPGRLIEYRMLKNPLVSHHRGELVFSEVNGKTELLYTIELESRLPLAGPALLMQLKLSATRGLKKLAANLA